jgi:ketosteroid isomerase-like protein
MKGIHMEHSSEQLVTANIALVQQLYGAFARRDIDALLNSLDADVEWGEPPNPFNPAGGTRHGHAGFLEWLQVGSQSEEILILEPRKFLADGDTVAVIGYTKCLAKPTGKIYETDFVHVVTVKDGKVKQFQEFFDTFAAAEAFRKN